MRKMKNIDIREKAKFKNVRLWEIAEKLGILDITFSKILREELSNEKKRQIFNIIMELSNSN